MGLRADASLWFNLPGIVAAYQPVRAPGPLLARYNQALGGNNTYQATIGVAPTWTSTLGWLFNGTTQYLNTNCIPIQGFSLVVKFDNVQTTAVSGALAGCWDGGAKRFFIIPRQAATTVRYGYGGGTNIAPEMTQGVLGMAPSIGYRNGVSDGAVTTGALHNVSIYIGGYNSSGALSQALDGRIQALAIYSRSLVAAEMWSVARQMTYCHVNQEWSAWGRRRQWFYAAATAEPDLGVAIVQDDLSLWVQGVKVAG